MAAGDLVYRISDDGDALLYLMDDEGVVRRQADDTAYEPPPEPPDWLVKVIMARRFIPDPLLAADFVLTRTLPESGQSDVAYVLYGDAYDGKLWRWTDAAWAAYTLRFTNAHLNDLVMSGGVYGAVIAAIDTLVSRIDPETWVTSANAGAENTSFSSLADLLAFYNARKAAMRDMQRIKTGRTGGGSFKMRPRAVGGEFNDYY
jgi:hypothetical protein